MRCDANGMMVKTSFCDYNFQDVMVTDGSVYLNISTDKLLLGSKLQEALLQYFVLFCVFLTQCKLVLFISLRKTVEMRIFP